MAHEEEPLQPESSNSQAEQEEFTAKRPPNPFIYDTFTPLTIEGAIRHGSTQQSEEAIKQSLNQKATTDPIAHDETLIQTLSELRRATDLKTQKGDNS